VLLINIAFPYPQSSVSASNALEVSVAQRLGLTDTELENFEEAIDIQELTGKALSRAVKNAQKNTKLQTAIEQLQSEGFVLRDGSVLGEEIRVGSGKDKRSIIVLILDYQNTDENIARLLYISDSQGDVRVGFGLIEQHGDMQTIRAYQVQDNNQIVEEPLIEVYEDGTIITYRDGQEYILTDMCTQSQDARTTAVSDNCLKCIQICNALYGLGCGLSGVLACVLVCAPIGGITCPLICGAVYTILCILGGGICSTVCGYMLGYCP
jgi:hypothetical protein